MSVVQSLKQAEKDVIAQVMKIYTLRSHAEQKQILDKSYDPKVVFEDPLMKVHGLANYRVQFHSLIKLFSVITVQYDLKGVQKQGNSVTVPNKQHYEFARGNWFTRRLLPEKVDLDVLTNIQFSDEGKVLSHVDVWVGHKEYDFHRHYIKPVSGECASFFMRMIGW